MPRWLKIVLGIAAGLAVVIAIAVTVALWATSGLIEPIERQLAALKAGNIEAAYAETSEAFHQATPVDKFTAFVEQFPMLKNVASHSFSSRSVENGVGKVSGTLTSPTGGVTPVEYQLVKENEAWKILYISLNGG
jgi:hypothetical protein